METKLKKNMKKTIVILIIVLSKSFSYAQQIDDQTFAKNLGAIIGSYEKGAEVNKAYRLAHEKQMMDKIQSSTNSLQSGDFSKSLNESKEGISMSNKYSVLYLNAAYSCLSLGNSLDAHKYLRQYDFFKSKKVNTELNKNIPDSFVN